MTKEEFAEVLRHAEEVVASWSEWKRIAAACGIDGRATNETPRPVVNNTPESDVY